MRRVPGRVVATVLVGALSSPKLAVAAGPCAVDPIVFEVDDPSIRPSLGPPIAATSPVDPGDPAARRALIEEQVETGAKQASAWAGAWGGAFGAAAVGQLVAASLIENRGLATDLYVGAGAAALGGLVRLVLTPGSVRARRQLKRSASERLGACEAAQQAERIMARAARAERRSRSLAYHALALGFSASVGILVGVGLRRPVSANRQVMIGGVVGQVMLLTMPTPMTRALLAYRRGARSSSRVVRARPMLIPSGGGASLGGRF